MILQSAAFVRAARRLVKKNPRSAAILQAALQAMEEDAFYVELKTHKLKGELAGSWACSAGYDLRIIFEFVQHNGNEAIQLQTVGTHDQVY
ncbi:MAG: type II toxin-antitoxin system YafQ family toxin [Planctomycetales bacterium]|nr:type II toxin-antitoxin system YafQ family toxin [Planctomycetales bacterium]